MSAVMNVGWKQKVQGQNVKKIIFCQSAKKNGGCYYRGLYGDSLPLAR